jgi:very-short-patch-repair endonuclease
MTRKDKTKTPRQKNTTKVTDTKYYTIVETDETTTKESVKESHLERRFRNLWAVLAADLPLESQKKHVVPGRRYVYDFCLPSHKVLFEINGGEYMRGKSGHSSASGIQRDADKCNQGQIQGYDVFMLNSCHLTVEYVGMLARYIREKKNAQS